MTNGNGTQEATTFEGWCVVELMGHQQIAGKVSEKAMFGTALMRVDVPETSKREAFTKFYGGSAIYAITPVSQAVARAMAEGLDETPIQTWRMKTVDPAPQLPETTSGGYASEDVVVDEDEPLDAPFVAPDDAMPDPPAGIDARGEAIQWAKQLLEGKFVIFDTETTGFGDDDEIIQIGIIDQDGKTVFESLIRSNKPISNSQYHGITDAMVKDAPLFSGVYREIKDALEGKVVVAYNFEYDNRMLQQVIASYGPEYAMHPITFGEQHCAMNWYAQYNGEWNDYNYRWKKLREALATFGLKHTDFGTQEHDACTDARATLAVIRKMAETDAPELPL